MNQYILGIDAGGTKTQGRLQCQDSSAFWSVKKGQGSLTNDIENACQNILEVIADLLELGKCLATETTLVCAAAGAENTESKITLAKTLSTINFKNLLITTDARASLYGAGRGSPIIVIAIGTGTVAMRIDKEGEEKQFGGWGFSVGDQGGGAFIGRELVTSILSDFDQDDFVKDDFASEVLKIIGADRQTISAWLKKATPSQFAELSPLVTTSATTNQLADNILQKAASEIEKLILTAKGIQNLPICLLGGLAKIILPLLSMKIQKQIIPAKGDAVDGAIFLGEQLINHGRHNFEHH